MKYRDDIEADDEHAVPEAELRERIALVRTAREVVFHFTGNNWNGLSQPQMDAILGPERPQPRRRGKR